MTSSGAGPWSVTTPYPSAAGGDPGTDMCNRVWSLVSGIEWVTLDWPALLTALMAVGRTDIPGARLAEGHVDALRILDQAGREPVAGALYGVWASRSRGGGLTSLPGDDAAHLGLTGTVPFASGAGLIGRALVTVTAEDGRSLLVDAPVADWPYDENGWHTTAMADSRSFTVTVQDRQVSTQDQVGPAGFYLDRPAFFPGGVGVAAVWAGAAAQVADRLVTFLEAGPEPGPVVAGHLGRIRMELVTIGAAIAAAGGRLSVVLGADDPDPGECRLLSTEVRAVVGAAVRRLLDTARAVAGPTGLAQEPGLGDAIADLDLYVRQQHADRDAESLGRL